MDFRMTVIPPSRQWNLTPDFDVQEDYDSLVMDTCALLSQTDCIFSASGFGQDDWPLDVPYDLSTVIEQLPNALNDFRQGRNAEIDFYGQGVERLITFLPLGETIAIRCTSRTDWVPNPDTVYGSREEAEHLLSGLARDFTASLSRASSTLAALPPFSTWT